MMTSMRASQPISSANVAASLAEVRERIVVAGGTDVDILAVTKTFGADAILAAVAAGCSAVGENYAQEVVAKRDVLTEARAIGERDGVPVGVHFIGQLQTNKVRLLAGLVDVYETVDRSSLATEIARRQPGANVLVQVATGSEQGKGGCPVDEVEPLLDECRRLSLNVQGLMTVGPTEGGPEAARPGFRLVRQLCDRFDLAICSMGMTTDLEVAVQEGSTQVRVGSALFGTRPTPGRRFDDPTREQAR